MNKSTAAIFFGIILAGLGVSLFVLKGVRKQDEPVAAVPPAAAEEATESPAPPEPPTLAQPKAEEPAASAPAPQKEPEPPAPVTVAFKTPEAALKALADRIGERDFEGFAALVAEGGIDPSIRPALKALVEDPALRLDPDKPQVEISKSAEALRWAFNFVPVTGEGPLRQLYADLAQGGEENLDIAKIALPIEVAAAKGAPDASPADPDRPAQPAAPATDPVALAAADALTVAHAFSKAVIGRDFKTARALADPGSVTDERVAALMIAVEEGKFSLREERPFVVTLSREDLTWVLARVQSEEAASEFAVELGKVENDWKVNGLTFSKVLSALSESAGAGEVAYSPIVEDPAGGDSLVLYFEFDDAGLTPRADRQLAIVAEILNQGEGRVIRISGHADALGSDQYNINLSNRRAEAIRRALVRRGVKPEQVVTEAYGAAKPRKPNFLPDGSDNPSGRTENRRAEVLLDF
jgi:OOP family OmpA-OmpF porin